MRFYSFLLLVLLGTCSAQARSHGFPGTAINASGAPNVTIDPEIPDDEPLEYYRIGANAYFLFGAIAQLNESNRGWMGNAGFIVTDEGVVVIDALGTPKLGRRFLATIRSVTDQPVRYLILTHNHPDHAYGAVAFKRAGAKVIANAGITDYLGSQTMSESVEYRRKLIPPDMEGFEAVAPDIVIDLPRFQKYRLTLGGETFDIYNVGQPHSHGDLVVHQLGDDIVWISDLAFNGRTTFMGDGNSKQILEEIEWLRTAFPDARLMVPGHGSAQTPPFPMLQATYDYVNQLRNEMSTAVEEGVSMQDAIDRSDLPQWQDMPLYKENHRRNAQFVYQEMESALFDE